MLELHICSNAKLGIYGLVPECYALIQATVICDRTKDIL